MSTMAEGVNLARQDSVSLAEHVILKYTYVEEDIYKKQGRVWERAGSHHGSCISLSTEFMIPSLP
jgi:hypothetical protein